jgi:hypothetical protein
MPTLSFNTAFASTAEDAIGLQPSVMIYAEDLNNCQECIDKVSSCYACLSLSQQIFLDSELTNVVPDGYYRFTYEEPLNPNAIWYIVGGYPQSEGFTNNMS